MRGGGDIPPAPNNGGAEGGAEALTPPLLGAGGKDQRLGTLLLLSCVAIWGMNAVAFKIGTQADGQFDAVFFNGLRFLVVAPVMVGILALRWPDALRVEHKRDYLRYALLGVFSIGISETLITLAVRYTSVANMTILGPGTIGLFTGLWAVTLKERKATPISWLGAAVALVGVGLVAGGGTGGFALHASTLWGDGLALGRSVMHGLYLLLLTRTLRQRPVLTVTFYNIVFGALAYVPYVLWKLPAIHWAQVTPAVWESLAFTIVPTTLYGFVAWNWGMRRVGAVTATNLFYLIPVFGAVTAWAVLGETLSWKQAVGGLVIVGGIVVLRWEEMRAGAGK